MAANLKVYNSAGSAEVTSISFTGYSPGTPSTEQTFRLFNDNTGGAVDTANEPALIVRAEDGSGDLVTEGVRALDERWLEAKLTGNGDAAGIVETGWVPIGRHRWMLFPEIESGEYVEFQLRENRPGSGGAGAVVYDLQTEPGQTAQALDLGRSESYRDGILTGLGDETWGEIIHRGGLVVEAGTPDTTVIMPDFAWRAAGGEPRVKLTHALTINDEDSAAASLASGEAYYAVISLPAGSSTPTVTKGVKTTTPLDPDTDAPALPAGERPVARVQRRFGTEIVTGDIVNLSTLGAFQMTSSSASLNVIIGTGRALVDNQLVRRTAESPIALTANETSHIWLLSSGAFSVTEDASRPEAGALLKYEATTDGTGVTAVVDHREWVGGERVLVQFPFPAGAIAGTEDSFVVWPYRRAGFVWPLDGATLSVGSNGAGNGAGELLLDVLATDGAGGAFTTLYTSSGTDDRRAQVNHDDTEPVARSGMPEVLRVEAGARLEAQLSFPEAYDVAGPTDAIVVLPVYLV